MQARVREWHGALGAPHERIVPRLRRVEPRKQVLGYLRGLLSPVLGRMIGT